MTHEEVVKILTKRKDKLGSWGALAKEIGISQAYLSQCLHGQSFGPKILGPYGLEAQTIYVRVK